jgi:multiple antibiotic resistance protein
MADNLWLFVMTVFMGFFAIINPLNTTPIFISLTQNVESEKVKRRIAFKSVLYTFIIIALFCVGGKIIFHVFGITLPAFQITGGILLFTIGVNLLHGQQSHIQHPSQHEKDTGLKDKFDSGAESLAISPLAIPILAGPGTISTAMNFVGATTKLDPFMHTAVVIIVFAVMCLITLVLFLLGERLIKFVGQSLISVVSRIMGLIVAVIAVQMVISGIINLIKMYHQNL